MTGTPNYLQQNHVEAVIKDVAHSVKRYGIKMLVLVNGHDANNSSMKYAARELMDELEIPVVYLFYPNMQEAMKEYCESPTWHGMIHACEFETSLMLGSCPCLSLPEFCRMEKGGWWDSDSAFYFLLWGGNV